MLSADDVRALRPRPVIDRIVPFVEARFQEAVDTDKGAIGFETDAAEDDLTAVTAHYQQRGFDVSVEPTQCPTGECENPNCAFRRRHMLTIRWRQEEKK